MQDEIKSVNENDNQFKCVQINLRENFRKYSVANYKLSVLENSKAFKYEFDDIKLKLVN